MGLYASNKWQSDWRFDVVVWSMCDVRWSLPDGLQETGVKSGGFCLSLTLGSLHPGLSALQLSAESIIELCECAEGPLHGHTDPVFAAHGHSHIRELWEKNCILERVVWSQGLSAVRPTLQWMLWHPGIEGLWHESGQYSWSCVCGLLFGRSSGTRAGWQFDCWSQYTRKLQCFPTLPGFRLCFAADWWR